MKKYKPGKPIKTLNELKKHKVVFVTNWGKAKPVAFFLSWPWRLIDGWVDKGYIRVAEKIPESELKKKENWFGKSSKKQARPKAPEKG